MREMYKTLCVILVSVICACGDNTVPPYGWDFDAVPIVVPSVPAEPEEPTVCLDAAPVPDGQLPDADNWERCPHPGNGQGHGYGHCK